MSNFSWLSFYSFPNFAQNFIERHRFNALFNAYNNLGHEKQGIQQKLKQTESENLSLKRKIKRMQMIRQKRRKKKVKRRQDEQIIKNNICPYPSCKKIYASELALNLHIKIKHQGGSKKDRRQFMKKLIKAEKNGDTPPINNLKIPIDVIDFYRKEFGSTLNSPSLEEISDKEGYNPLKRQLRKRFDKLE